MKGVAQASFFLLGDFSPNQTHAAAAQPGERKRRNALVALAEQLVLHICGTTEERRQVTVGPHGWNTIEPLLLAFFPGNSEKKDVY